MKKVVSLLLCMVLLLVASTASAYTPGDTVTVTVSITSATAATARITVDANNDDVLIFQSATKTMPGMGFAPQKDGAAFTVISADMVSPVPTGVVGTVTYKIANDAPAGKYSISVTGEGVTASGSTTVVVGCKEHKWDDGVEKTKPTCEKEGEMLYTCTECKETKTESIAKVPHDKDVVKTITEPTCTEPGSKAYFCSMCEKQQGEAVEVEPTGHKPGSAEVAQQPTCTEPGMQSYTCTVCGAKIEGEVIPALGHNEEVLPSVPATCEEAGKTEGKYCTVCDEVLVEQNEIPALGHNEVDDPAVEATCTEPGKTAGSHCSNCNKVFVAQEEIPALGHTEVVIPGTPATCTKPGLTDGKKCTVCGEETQKQTEIEKLPHTPSEDAVIVKPTCTEDGSETYTCTVCGESVSGNVLPALGHDYDEGVVVTAATCETDGEKLFTCQNDPSHTYTEAIEKLGHDWSEWVVTQPATDEEDGLQERTCARCGKVETQVIYSRPDFVMTVCTEGIRFRDLENPITNYWYMFTPIDISVDGVQEIALIAGNVHRIGTAYVTVKEGTVTVTYKLNNKIDIKPVYNEFMTILPSLEAAGNLDFNSLTNYAFGKAISIEEDLGGDTNVLLLLRNRVTYNEGVSGIDMFRNDEAYKALVEKLMLMMD